MAHRALQPGMLPARSADGSCNAYGCSDHGTCNAYGCPGGRSDGRCRPRRRASLEPSCIDTVATERDAFEHAIAALAAARQV